MRNEWRVTLGEEELESLNHEGLDCFHWHRVCLQERELEEELGNRMALEHAAKDVRRRRWKKWLESGMYGAVVQARLDQMDDGCVGAGRMELGRSQKKALEKAMRRYVLVDGTEVKHFFREKNGELASCVLEKDVSGVLTSLHEGHGHLRMVLPWGGRTDEFTGLSMHMILGAGFLFDSHARALRRCKRQENYDQLSNSSQWI